MFQAARRNIRAIATIGLAIVRELTEAMGGSVGVENLPEGGARFTIRLPASG
jgi:signal transduction histidine kinase